MPQSIALLELITEKLYLFRIFIKISLYRISKVVDFFILWSGSHFFVIEFAKTYYIVSFNVIFVNSKITKKWIGIKLQLFYSISFLCCQETFFATFKKEEAYRREYTSEQSFSKALSNIFDSIMKFVRTKHSNTRRRRLLRRSIMQVLSKTGVQIASWSENNTFPFGDFWSGPSKI